jgi:putative SOS response-associated peptidase YedK
MQNIMCGRFTLTATPDALQQLFPLFEGIDLPPQYNVAPSQNVLAVRLRPDSGQPEAVRLRWGLVPSWADDVKIGYRLINARMETVRSKPAFRAAFKQRHCLVLADGFYEWQKSGSKKQPYHIRRRDGRPFAFAGLWERWHKDEEAIESCTILTTAANATVRPVHDRMPFILDQRDHEVWLDAGAAQASSVLDVLRPCPAEVLTAVAVSAYVNSPRNNDPECLTPVHVPAALF